MHLYRSRHLHAAVLAVALLAATGLLPAIALPAAAVVRFEPAAPPSPMPRLPGGRIEVPWAGIAVTFPDDWLVKSIELFEPTILATDPGP